MTVVSKEALKSAQLNSHVVLMLFSPLMVLTKIHTHFILSYIKIEINGLMGVFFSQSSTRHTALRRGAKYNMLQFQPKKLWLHAGSTCYISGKTIFRRSNWSLRPRSVSRSLRSSIEKLERDMSHLFYIVLLLGAVNTVDALPCSCPERHPQEVFCSAHFGK